MKKDETKNLIPREKNKRYYLRKRKLSVVGKKKSKKNIPKGLKEQVWKKYNGKTFEAKCYISWCSNIINAFNFHVGHNKPESKGGHTKLSNLRPICDRCNLSMSNNYTIQEWNNQKFDDKTGCNFAENKKNKYFLKYFTKYKRFNKYLVIVLKTSIVVLIILTIVAIGIIL